MLKQILKFIWLIWCWLEVGVLTLSLYILSWLPRALLGRPYYNATRYLSKLFVQALNINLKLHQKNTQPLPKHFILIANHPSSAEDFAIPTLFDALPLAKQGVRNWYFIGRISYAAGTIYVKRDNKESRHAALESLIETVSNGKNISIFPEGGCKGRRIYKEFQTGAFDISIKTGTAILPVFIHYEAQDRFEWRKPYSLIGMFWRIITSQNNTANYYVFDAISPEDYTDKHQFAESVHAMYLQWQKKYLE